MGLFFKRVIDKVMPEYGLIGTDGVWDSVLGEHDIVWDVVPLSIYTAYVVQGIGELRGYKVVNEIVYWMIYLPPVPHLREYEE